MIQFIPIWTKIQRFSSVLIAIDHKTDVIITAQYFSRSIKNRMDIISNFLDRIYLTFYDPVTQYHNVLMHIFAIGMYHSFCAPAVPIPLRVVRPMEEERA